MTSDVKTAMRNSAGYVQDRYGERYILLESEKAQGTDLPTAIYIDDDIQTVALGQGFRFIEINKTTLQWLFSEAVDRGWYDV